MALTVKSLLRLAFAAGLLASPPVAFAQDAAPAAQDATKDAASPAEPSWRHASALVGQPKYPAGFEHFSYVNPNAPKGGTVRLSGSDTFDTLNPILPRGVPADGLGLVFETLMTSALDELDISGEYGLLAEALRFPED